MTQTLTDPAVLTSRVSGMSPESRAIGAFTEVLRELNDAELNEIGNSPDEFAQHMAASARNFARPRIIRSAIERGKYDGISVNDKVYVTCPTDTVPLDQTERVVNGKYRSNRDVLEQYPLEYFAPLLTLLELGEKEPDAQRQAPIATMWRDSDGKLWYAILNEGTVGRRLNVGRVSLSDDWGGNCEFLLRKSK